jgi:ribosomal protein S18 acetylase RimI-like enzyme
MKPEVTVRITTPEEAPVLKAWFLEPEVLRNQPMCDEREIDDAVRIWSSYARIGAALTAEIEGEPCGIAIVYIAPFKKLAHQALFAIIVSSKLRNRGIGTVLMQKLMEHAKEKFKIELLHLEVYEGNPAIRLYERLGFKEYGRHPRFLKQDGEYITKIFMQKRL